MRRIVELDALRGLAAVLIMLAHAGIVYDNAWVWGLVDLFFVISGSFITGNILRGLGRSGFYHSFFRRRVLRTWPAYFLALAACLILSPLVKWDRPLTAWPYYLTFTQLAPLYFGLAAPSFSMMFLHTWTMAIEEQFYLLWPWLGRRAGHKHMPALIAGAIIVAILLRAWYGTPALLLTRCDSLALGAILGLLLTRPDWITTHRKSLIGLFAGIAALTLGIEAGFGSLIEIRRHNWPATPGLAIAASLDLFRVSAGYFAIVGLVLMFAGHRLLAPLRWRLPVFFGEISYGLYLYHPLVFGSLPRLYRRFVIRKLGLESEMLMEIAMLAVCVGLAALSRRTFEAWFLALKDGRSSSPPAAESPRRDDAHQTIPHGRDVAAAHEAPRMTAG